MAFQALTTAEVDADSPLTETLMTKIKDNFDDLDARADVRTGSIAIEIDDAAKTGWVRANDGTIGSATSGASERANADTEDLFKLLWDKFSNSQAPVSGGRGVSAQADFDANKTIQLGKLASRALGVAGSGSGLTTRANGVTTGAETVALATGNHASHNHGILSGIAAASANALGWFTNLQNVMNNASSQNQGSGTAHNNMQPSVFLIVFIKL